MTKLEINSSLKEVFFVQDILLDARFLIAFYFSLHFVNQKRQIFYNINEKLVFSANPS
jgi:hypothetical protein